MNLSSLFVARTGNQKPSIVTSICVAHKSWTYSPLNDFKQRPGAAMSFCSSAIKACVLSDCHHTATPAVVKLPNSPNFHNRWPYRSCWGPASTHQSWEPSRTSYGHSHLTPNHTSPRAEHLDPSPAPPNHTIFRPAKVGGNNMGHDCCSFRWGCLQEIHGLFPGYSNTCRFILVTSW